MSQPPIHGHTKTGRPITDQDIESLAAEAEAGYDIETLIARRNKRGRPTLGNAPASVESGWTLNSAASCSTAPRPREPPPPS